MKKIKLVFCFVFFLMIFMGQKVFALSYHKLSKNFFSKFKIKYPTHFKNDLFKEIKDQELQIEQLKNEFSYLIERYEKLINCKKYEDFSQNMPGINIPDLKALINISKFYLAVKIINAINGEFEKVAEDLLKHIDFCKKVLRSSRSFIINKIIRNNMILSIEALAIIMNQTSCPSAVFSTVKNRISPMKNEEIGNKIPYISGYLSNVWLVNIFQENKI